METKVMTQAPSKYGARIVDATGRVVALYNKVKLGDRVIWLGRKQGKGANDHRFEPGKDYEVCYIYESNGDLELQGDEAAITTRAGPSEYSVRTGCKVMRSMG
jgi:hypothetical protein